MTSTCSIKYSWQLDIWNNALFSIKMYIDLGSVYSEEPIHYYDTSMSQSDIPGKMINLTKYKIHTFYIYTNRLKQNISILVICSNSYSQKWKTPALKLGCFNRGHVKLQKFHLHFFMVIFCFELLSFSLTLSVVLYFNDMSRNVKLVTWNSLWYPL